MSPCAMNKTLRYYVSQVKTRQPYIYSFTSIVEMREIVKKEKSELMFNSVLKSIVIAHPTLIVCRARRTFCKFNTLCS